MRGLFLLEGGMSRSAGKWQRLSTDSPSDLPSDWPSNLPSQFVNRGWSHGPNVWRRSLSVAIALCLCSCAEAAIETAGAGTPNALAGEPVSDVAATTTEATEVELNDALEQPKELREGPVQVRFRYRQDAEAWSGEVQYTLLYNGQPQLEQTQESTAYGGVRLQDLDADGTAEVIIRTYSGGAHCCTSHIIHRWQGDRFETTDTGFRDGEGGSFRDLDGDGRLEFVAFDNAFLYAFSSYAGSFPPSQIWALQDGQLVDVTRQYPAELRAIANQMRDAVLTVQADTNEVNGILAGYVAQMILLGEYEQGWAFMLANYDRTSDWGLEIYKDGQVVYRYPDFPAALEAFLTEQGYLPAEGSAAR